jgi:TPR repeat protein
LAAAQGYVDAQVELGGWYGLWGPIACATEGRNQKEQGCPKEYDDPAEAMRWYRLAAEKNNATGQLNVGSFYESGKGVDQDYHEAVKWYRQAAEQGDSRAQFALGKTYAEGKGVPQDYVLAYMWINLAGVEADGNAIDKLLESRNSTVKFRDSLAAKMTAQQIGEAQRLSRECAGKKYKGC